MSKKHSEDLFDSLIKHAGHEILEQTAENAPSQKEAREIVGDTQALDKKIKKIINKDKNKRRRRKANKVILRVAAVLVALIIVSTVAIASSEALRIRFLDLFVSSNEISTDLDFSEVDPAGVPDNIVMPKYLPEGYVLSEFKPMHSTSVSKYTNESGSRILITQYEGAPQISVDNESYECEIIEIGGRDAYTFEREGSSIVVFYSKVNVFKVSGAESLEELVRMARSMVE